MNKKMKMLLKCFGIFIFILGWNLIASPMTIDEVWNYGFAHNFYVGLTPYQDFNMVIPPLFPFLMSLPFYLFGSNMLIFHIIHALFMTIMFFFLDEMIGKNSIYVLFLLCFPISILFPSYNLFLLFLFVLIIYLEKKNKSDYLIGFLIGCMILTKHTVGIFFLLPSLFYLKDKKKIGKRLFTCSVPIIIFIFYLIGTKSISQFFDLCILGLFDFGKENGNFLNIYSFLSFILFFVTCYFIYKDRKNINWIYYLCFMSSLLPLFDLYHFNLVVAAFLIIIFVEKNRAIVQNKINIHFLVFLSLFCLFISSVGEKRENKVIYPNSFNHFEYRFLSYSYVKKMNAVNQAINQYEKEGKKVIILGSNSYYFRLVRDEKISYIDLINQGNWGYHGNKKLLQEIKNKVGYIFFIDMKEIITDTGTFGKRQTDQSALYYIMKHGKKIDCVKDYNIYILE